MLQFKNKTPFPGTMFVTADERGVETAYAVLKATYILTASPTPAEKQSPVALADEFFGDPLTSSIKSASDFALRKPATDVILQGYAFAPGERAVSQVDVSLAAGDTIRKVVRVFGDRAWAGTGILASSTAPQPFIALALTWERASGGFEDPNNPVGCTRRCPPNLEDPRYPATSPTERRIPAGFGPLSAHWEPRRSCAGTYDDNWVANRAPYLPADFSPWYFQLAPSDQCVPGYLQGGEPVVLSGCVPEGRLQFALPRHTVRFGFRLDDELQVRPANLDTVAIDTASMLLRLTWRACLPCDKKALRIREVEVRVT